MEAGCSVSQNPPWVVVLQGEENAIFVLFPSFRKDESFYTIVDKMLNIRKNFWTTSQYHFQCDIISSEFVEISAVRTLSSVADRNSST